MRNLAVSQGTRFLTFLRTVKLVSSRVCNDPVAGVFRGAERIPVRLRSPALKFAAVVVAVPMVLGLDSGSWRATRAAILASDGRHARAAELIKVGLRSGLGPLSLGQLAQVALRMQRDDLAEAALDGLQPHSEASVRAKAALMFRTGRLETAEALLAALQGEGRASQRGLDQLVHVRGKQAVLRGDWSWKPPAWEAGSPVPGRILHVLTNSLPHKHAGYTLRAQAVAVAQRSVGLDPHFVTRAGFPQLQGVVTAPDRERVEAIPYYRLPLKADCTPPEDQALAATAEGLVSLARELRPACLQPASHHFNAQAALAARKVTGLPVVYEVRGFLEETWLSRFTEDARDRDYYQLSRLRETHCMIEADHVITLAEVMREEIANRGVPRERITVVPNAVDGTVFTPGRPNWALRASLGIPQGAMVLGYVGSLVSYEGLDTLIHSLGLLRARRHNVHLLLVGDGEERAKLAELASSLGLAAHVSLPGRVTHDAIVEYYRLIDVFVVPRRHLNVCRLVTPIKPLEAMSCGKAPVISALPALTELTDGDTAGRTFWPVEEVTLADRLEELILDSQQREELGEAARQRVLAQYTWEANADRYLALAYSLGLL